MPNAARISDSHTCPIPTPHVGGPISSGSATVIVEGRPAARVGDAAICVGGGSDSISTGSATVIIDGAAAARLGDSTAHGGVITGGASTVIIGDSSWYAQSSGAEIDPLRQHFIEVHLHWMDGTPCAYTAVEITAADGTVVKRTLDRNGWARVSGLPEGPCRIAALEAPTYASPYLHGEDETRKPEDTGAPVQKQILED